jgi:hypothetical protein
VKTGAAAIAVAPIKLPGGVKTISQGYVLGNIAQSFIGNPLAGALGGNSSSGPWL